VLGSKKAQIIVFVRGGTLLPCSIILLAELKSEWTWSVERSCVVKTERLVMDIKTHAKTSAEFASMRERINFSGLQCATAKAY